LTFFDGALEIVAQAGCSHPNERGLGISPRWLSNFGRLVQKPGCQRTWCFTVAGHDFGTRVLKKTGNLKLVMQTMGQKDVKTAMKYQHPELDIVRTVLNETAPGAPQNARRHSLLRHTFRHTSILEVYNDWQVIDKNGERGRNRTFNLLMEC
jgi:hypothetical protein